MLPSSEIQRMKSPMNCGLPRLSLFLLLFAPLAAQAQQPITLTSPLDYQVFQASRATAASSSSAATSPRPTDKLEARILNTPDTRPAHSFSRMWLKLAVRKVTGEFDSFKVGVSIDPVAYRSPEVGLQVLNPQKSL